MDFQALISVFPKKNSNASNHGEKVFQYADLSLGYVGISHYMSGLYCFKLDHFQTRAESIYILIYINSHFKVFAKVLILVEFLG